MKKQPKATTAGQNPCETTAYAEDVVAGRVVVCRFVKLACERHLRDLARTDGKVWFDRAAAERFFEFCEEFLRHYKGDSTGKPVILLPWQRFCFGCIYGWKRIEKGVKTDYFRFRYAYLEVPRKQGKALALDTPIPTPSGWKTIGELCEGDMVYAANGSPSRVVATSEIFIDHDCYRIDFSNGESVVADAGHRWLTTARVDVSGRRSRVGMKHGASLMTRVRTTEEIFKTQTYGARNDRNHSIKMPEGMDGVEIHEPFDFYALGYWLGDGSTGACIIHAGEEDVPHIEAEFSRAGIKTVVRRRRTAFSIAFNSGRRGDSARAIRSMGCFDEKHIPVQILRASRSQRIALLQGLMDSDGMIGRNGIQMEYAGTNGRLMNGVGELLASLGIKHRLSKKRTTCQNGAIGTAWRIRFTTTRDHVECFRLPRKLARQRKAGATSPRCRSVQIVGVSRVESVPVKCIAIEHPSHLFIFGRSMLPTHNTTIAAATAAYDCVALDPTGAQVYIAATKEDQAKQLWDDVAAFIEISPDLGEMLRVTGGIKTIFSTASKTSFIKPIGSNSKRQDGFNPFSIVCDELHAWPGRKLWDVLTGSFGARKNYHVIAITTGGDDTTGICYAERKHLIDILEGRFEADNKFGVIYTLDEGEEKDWQNPAMWYKANPSLGEGKELSVFEEAVTKAKQEPSSLLELLQKQFNIWTDAANAWISTAAWKSCAGEWNHASLKGLKCYAAIDLSRVNDLSAVAYFFPKQAGLKKARLVVFFFIPAEGLPAREIRDGVPYRQWAAEGHVIITPGKTTDFEWIADHIRKRADEWIIESIAYDRHFAGELVQTLTKENFVMVPHGQGFWGMGPPSSDLERMIVANQFEHDGNPCLSWNASNCIILKDPAGLIKPDKSASKKRIDGIVAGIMAISGAMGYGKKDDDAAAEKQKALDVVASRGFRFV